MKRLCACALAISFSFACNNNGGRAPPPPVDDTAAASNHGTRALPGPQGRSQDPSLAPRRGMTTGQKVVVLGGAAALYYLYKHHQNATAQQGPDSQYYLSKNGRVYYRDADHRAHWVTPPQEGIAVPESEARDYQQFQGYDNRQTGQDLSGLASDNSR